MLINAGASFDGVPDWSVVFLASLSTVIIRALVNRGVDLNQLHHPLNMTPLHFVAMSAERLSVPIADVQAIVTMLVNDCGVDLEARNDVGETCTHIGCKFDNSAVRCFIEAGADVNCIDNDGQTPLHRASGYHCVVLLVAAGANVSARDERGQTAFQALWGGTNSQSMLPAFVAAGADQGGVDRRVTDVDDDQVESARREIAKVRLDFVRRRATDVCIGLAPLRLDALQMCEILQHSCGPLAHLIAFHQWWTIATTVKHFLRH
jgi:hypothetical protein